MKKAALTLIIILCATLARAQLIDLTPGGFNPEQGLPPPFFLLIDQTFFDEAAHGWFDLPPPDGLTYINGWVSRYGELDGGVYFFTNLFVLGDTPSASVWWDFRQEPQGMTMLDVWGRKPDGTPWEHIYGVRRNKQRKSPPVMVTLDGMTFINSIAFYGTDGRRHFGRRPATLLRDLMRLK